MNTDYEVYTQHKQGIPCVPADMAAGVVFELGEPAQTLGGVNGFLTEVSTDGTEGVLDIGTSQVYQTPVVITGTLANGALLYYDTATGALSNTAGALKVFGRAVRRSYTETFPIAAGTVVVGVLVSN